MRSNGFTIVEMLTVLVVVGAMSIIGFPKIRSAIEKQNFRSARGAVGSYVVAARAAAITRGCRSTVYFVNGVNSRMWATTCRSQIGALGRDTIAKPEFPEQRWSVRLQSAADSIVFDPRGMRVTLTATTIKLRTTANVDRDSVVINELGKVERQ